MRKALIFMVALLTAVTCRAQSPTLSISRSISIGEEYARSSNVDLSGQFIHLVKLEFEEGKGGRGYFWRIRWRWKVPRLGGEYGMRVYMDGHVETEIAGP